MANLFVYATDYPCPGFRFRENLHEVIYVRAVNLSQKCMIVNLDNNPCVGKCLALTPYFSQSGVKNNFMQQFNHFFNICLQMFM